MKYAAGMSASPDLFQKTVSMQRGASVCLDRRDMFFCAIADMAIEPILWMGFMRASHERVAVFLGNDRSERDGGNMFVALNDGRCGKANICCIIDISVGRLGSIPFFFLYFSCFAYEKSSI